MQPVLSREQIRAFDRHAVERCAVPSLLLMENAGRGAAEHIAELLGPPRASARVLVVCGTGNNGGDGFVVARRLTLLGYHVSVVLVGSVEQVKGDARSNHDAWIGVGGSVRAISGGTGPGDLRDMLEPCSVVVDALLGTGLDRAVEGELRDVVDVLNAAPVRRVALDVPSGLDADTGRVLGAAVRAGVTLTFAHYKLGLLTPAGREHAGRTHVIDIGVPAELWQAVGQSASCFEAGDVAKLIAPRSPRAHKASAGRVSIFAGSPGKVGAALLVANGALRAGAGLVTLCGVPELATALEHRVLEAMTARIDPARAADSALELCSDAGAVAIGPGVGLDAASRELVHAVVLGFSGRMVVDADALTHFAGRIEALRGAAGQLVLTPHPGEAARLLDASVADVESDRYAAARTLAERTGATVLLKGAYTLIAAPDHTTAVNTTGSPVLATGGTGDVLCGIVAALLCHAPPFDAAVAAAFVHGLASEAWTNRHRTDRGLLAHEIADDLPAAFASLAAPNDVMPV